MSPETTAFIESVSRHATAMLVYPAEGPDTSAWLTGGTGVLVQTPITRFIVTADHVIVEIERLRRLREIVVLIGGVHAPPFDVSDWPVIDRDSRIDICILQVPDAFQEGQTNLAFYATDFEEVSFVQEGDEALIIGFPQAHRIASPHAINARMLPINDFVRSVSETRFVVADPNNERKILRNPSDLAIPEHMGGASGAPVFKVMEDKKYELIGIFTHGNDGLHGAHICTHIRFLKNSGKIDSLKLPPY